MEILYFGEIALGLTFWKFYILEKQPQRRE